MANQQTVLIVDDDPAIRKMLVEVFQLEGIPAETAVNGREAMDILARSGPRVVLLDLLMPVLNGWGVIDELNQDPALRGKHKIILMSAWTTLEQAKDVESDGRLGKPFTVSQILNALANVNN